jgi:hypothetical protein
MGITTKVFHFSDQSIPWHEWEHVIKQSNGDLFMVDPRFLACVERSICSKNKIWYVLFYSENGSPVALSCLSTLATDLAIISGSGLQRIMDRLRKIFPSFLYLNFLYCGQPISLGQKGIFFTSNARRNEILAELDNLMSKLARQEKAKFIVHKEYDENDIKDFNSLCERGYKQAESLEMHFFNEPFTNFDHYLLNLNSKYRYDIRRSLRKMKRAGLTIVRWTDPETIENLYTNELHELYRAVANNSENRLEILPVAFFHELTRQFPGKVALTGLVRDGQILAFNWSITADSKYQFLFCGIDYRFNNEFDLYFNLMYAELDYALQSQSKEIKIGQTAPHFKTRLGCIQRSVHFYIKGIGFFTNLVLKLFFNLLFPPRREKLPPANIYHSKYQRAYDPR